MRRSNLPNLGGWLDLLKENRGSILQAGTCQIFNQVENSRWSRVWQLAKQYILIQ